MRALGLLLALAACAHNPVATAAKAAPENRAETIAFAMHNSYVVLVESAANIAEDSTTPRAVKAAIVGLNRVATPFAKRLHAATLEYRHIRESLATQPDAAGKIAAALAELNRAITDFAPKLDAFAREIGGAK